MDRQPTKLSSTRFVKVKQWDRYCFENYLIDEKILFDIIVTNSNRPPSSRGSFSQELQELAMSQLTSTTITNVYSRQIPENPGLRPTEIAGKDFKKAAEVLVARLDKIKEQLAPLNQEEWMAQFVSACNLEATKLSDEWRTDWIKKCDGKKLVRDLYKKYEIKIDQLTFKKRVIKRMQTEKSEGWRLIESILRDAIS